MLLAVDGGATSLRMQTIGDPNGENSVDVPGFQWSAGTDPVELQANVVVDAWERLGKPAPVDVIALGLAGGASDPDGRRRLASVLAERLTAREVRLTGDGITNHLGVLGGDPGVMIGAGTGVTCLSVTPGGELHYVDGMGYLFGDRGGGFSIGLAGLRAALAAVEGTGRDTELVDRAAAVMGVPPPAMPVTIRQWYSAPTLVADVAAFARQVTDIAVYDGVARAICLRAGAELGDTAVAAAKFGSADSEAANSEGISFEGASSEEPESEGGRGVAVSWSGSILNAPEVFESFERTLLAAGAWIELRAPAGDAMAGAIRLAQLADDADTPHLAGVVLHR